MYAKKLSAEITNYNQTCMHTYVYLPIHICICIYISRLLREKCYKACAKEIQKLV